MNDLRQITKVTGDEYSIFTLKGQRIIIRGNRDKVKVSEQMYNDLVNGKSSSRVIVVELGENGELVLWRVCL